jgi:hypothetical protein
MRKPRTTDDWWYQKIKDAEPKKIYRNCPRCGMKTGIPEIYPTRFCYICKATVYIDEELNEKARKKYKFLKEMERNGINVKKSKRKKRL